MKLPLLIILAVICFGCSFYGFIQFMINNYTFVANNPSLLFIISTFITGFAVTLEIIKTRRIKK